MELDRCFGQGSRRLSEIPPIGLLDGLFPRPCGLKTHERPLDGGLAVIRAVQVRENRQRNDAMLNALGHDDVRYDSHLCNLRLSQLRYVLDVEDETDGPGRGGIEIAECDAPAAVRGAVGREALEERHASAARMGKAHLHLDVLG